MRATDELEDAVDDLDQLYFSQTVVLKQHTTQLPHYSIFTCIEKATATDALEDAFE